MEICYKSKWDFELLDSGEGYRLERFGDVKLKRPDPQVIWKGSLSESDWHNIEAEFINRWNIKNKEIFKKPWVVKWQDTKFLLKLSPFKHTGLFAEQAGNWEWLTERMKNKESRMKNEKPKILNLFGYTGAATMVLTRLGCFVTHVDASKPTIGWAKENQALNKLPSDAIRWILDDCAKFVKREVKRGALYDGIIMDPPAFGHSPTGGTWKFNEDLPGLLRDCIKLLSPDAKFLLINGYATNSSGIALGNILEDETRDLGGKVEFGELCLKETNRDRMLSTGIFARWSR